MSMYEPIKSKVDFSILEEEILDYWNKHRIFEQSLQARKGEKEYVFYDGPPFATGYPHYGHLLAGTIKDIIPRYKTMKGYYVSRRFGWDCHGLPIEMEMQSKLGLRSSEDVVRYGVKAFNEACRENVLRYTEEWEKVTKRMGRWVDFEKAYRTMDKSFMESVWWVFSELHRKQLIYEGVKVLPYSWKASTILSNFEANLNYKTIQDPALTVKFRIASDKTVVEESRNLSFKRGEWLLAWTTTPWTLIANLGLCVGGEIEYVKVRHQGSGEVYILSQKSVVRLFGAEEKVEVLDRFTGAAMEGLKYDPLFEYAGEEREYGEGSKNSPETDKDGSRYQIFVDDFVKDEEGVGIVHMAPAYGEDDSRIGEKHGLGVYDPIDADGNFKDPNISFLRGMHFQEANKPIIRFLKERGAVLRHEVIEHPYPFCWRTDTPLMYKAHATYFVDVGALKEQMIANNQTTSWTPKHLREGRFGKWLEGANDWAISRSRHWGTPIPLWKNDRGHVICCGVKQEKDADGLDFLETVAVEETGPFYISVLQLEQLCGQTIEDIHGHHLIDLKVFIERKKGSHSFWGGTYHWEGGVLDCWFDSGSMPFAKEHFPFETGHKLHQPPSYPADFIAEGLDQTRGWFYTLLVLSTAIYNKSPYQNVVVNGLILASDGRKMSKRLQNYPSPQNIMQQYGADALRLYMAHSGAVKGESLRFSEEGVLNMVKSVMLPLWNGLSFFVSYASIDGWVCADQKDTMEVLMRIARSQQSAALDKWILSLLQTLIRDVEKLMDSYELIRATDSIIHFIDRLTNVYIRQSRRRFWKSHDDTDKYEAYTTLYYTLKTLAELLGPFTPFIAEKIHCVLHPKQNRADTSSKQSIRRGKQVGTATDQVVCSVHLEDFPILYSALVNKDLEADMELVETVLSLGRSLRLQQGVMVRQPLASLTVISRQPQILSVLQKHREQLKKELNVKALEVDTEEHHYMHYRAKCHFKTMGKKYGKQVKLINETVMALGQEDVLRFISDGAITVEVMTDGEKKSFVLQKEDLILHQSPKKGFCIATDGEVTCMLNASLTDALRGEGLAREFINRIQKIRKEMDLHYTDRIAILFYSESEVFSEAWLQQHQAMIAREVLATSICISATVVKTSPQTPKDATVSNRVEQTNNKAYGEIFFPEKERFFYAVEKTEKTDKME